MKSTSEDPIRKMLADHRAKGSLTPLVLNTPPKYTKRDKILGLDEYAAVYSCPGREREKAVVEYLISNISGVKMVVNKGVPKLETCYRFDIRLDHKFMIAVEIDEYAHKHYDQAAETRRMADIMRVHSGVVIIRFNPDTYYENGQKIKGCWRYVDGHMTLVDHEQWVRRLETLLARIKYWLGRSHGHAGSAEYLYFGDHAGKNK